MHRVRFWLLAIRPKTLTAALVPILAATAFVFASGNKVHIWISALAFLASIFIQIGTNLVNDAIDFKKGADDENRIGPLRVTQSGIFSAHQVMLTGSGFFLLAILSGVPLVIEGGLPILLIGILAVIFGYAYTAGPFPLAYLGLGDIFVVIFFGLVAVAGLFFLQTQRVSFEPLLIGLQIGLHCTVLIAINNLRDMHGDLKAHKKTLPVRFGKKFARFEIATLCFLPFALQIYWLFSDFYLAGLLGLFALPYAVNLVKLVFCTEPGSTYNQFLGKAAALHLVFGSMLSLGFVLKGIT